MEEQFLKECKEVRDDFAKIARQYNVCDNLELRTEIDSLLIMYDQLCERVRVANVKLIAAAPKISDYILNVNTILHTKDGSKIGNAIVTGREGLYWEVTTDYGNKVKFTIEEIDEYFNIAWSNYSKEIDGVNCQEMQEMMSYDHKHRVS